MALTVSPMERHGPSPLSKTFGETDIIVLGAGCIGLTAARALVIILSTLGLRALMTDQFSCLEVST